MTVAKFNFWIEEKIPLKQGLKHEATTPIAQQWIIEEKIPLKQGLKHTGAWKALVFPAN